MSDDVRVLLERLERLLENVHQYVGARYVPRFIDEPWNDTTGYEPLDVVDNGQGTSYIAKKPVPPGTPLSDRTYWFVYGTTSGAILNLQNQIDAIVNNELPALKKPYNNFIKYGSDRLVVFIGDSYTQVPSSAGSFVGKVANYLGLTSSQYHNIGVSGHGLDGYKIQVDNYNYADGDSVTDVVITGGINDAHSNISDPATIEAKIDTLYNTVVAKFPNATIWAGFCGGGFYRNLTTTYAGFNYDNVMLLKYIWMERWTAKPKCVYMEDLDLWCRSLSETDYYLSGGNGMHPYNLGIQTLADMITNYLKGGGNALNDLTSIDCPIVANTTLDVNVWNLPSSMKVTKRGRISSLFLGYGSVSFNTPIVLSYGSAIRLANMIIDNENEVLAVYTNKRISSSSFVWYTVNGSNYNIMPIEIRIEGEKIIFLPYPANPSITDVTALFFPGFDITCPTDMVL